MKNLIESCIPFITYSIILLSAGMRDPNTF